MEVEEIVEDGEIKPEEIHLPRLYVNQLFKGAKYEHKVEILKVAEDSKNREVIKPTDARSTIAARDAKELKLGMNVNLGIGIPTLAAEFAAAQGTHVFLQSENGMNGVGNSPKKSEVDSDWINAGKETVLPVPGASTFGSDESFGQIRDGHLDITVLGALECSQYGDIANFMIAGKMVKGMGGALVSLDFSKVHLVDFDADSTYQDLVSNPEQTQVMVTQTHCNQHGNPKIKEKCDMPLTGARCVHTIVTDLAVFDVDPKQGLTLRDYNPKSSIEEIKKKTAAPFKVKDGCGPWKI